MNQPQDVTLREVEDFAADWPVIWEMIRELDEHHASVSGRPLVPDRDREKPTRKIWEKPFSKGRMIILIAEVDGEPAGLASGKMQYAPWIFDEEVGIFTTMFVKAKFRSRTDPNSRAPTHGQSDQSRSIFWQLHNYMINWFRERNASEIQGVVLNDNKAIMDLWLRVGYTPFMTTVRLNTNDYMEGQPSATGAKAS